MPDPNIINIALLGDYHVGKTSAAMDIITRLEPHVRVGGVLQPSRFHCGQRVGYDLYAPALRQHYPFAAKIPKEEGKLSYRFDPGGWRWAATRILCARRDAHLCVVDELGRLEADTGRGHLVALLAPLPNERPQVRLLTLRADRHQQLAAALGTIHHTFQIPLTATDRLQIIALIHAYLGPP